MPHERANESRLTNLYMDVVVCAGQCCHIRREGGGDPLDRIVEEVEIVAEAYRVRLEMQRGATSEVAVGCSALADEREHFALKAG